MKKVLLITNIILAFISGIYAQDTTSKQQILDLTIDELSKIGFSFKNQQIIYKNKMPRGDNIQILIDKNSIDKNSIYNDISDSILSTNFDFYPYYFSDIDSICKHYHQTKKYENKLKMDPLFERKMKLNYLVPVLVKLYYDSIKPEKEFIFWFVPTESFCKLIPPRYKITRKYVPDSLITSNVALELEDCELRNIGFVIDNEEMYLNTYNNGFICMWHNDKNNCGTAIITETEDIENFLKKKDKKNEKYNIENADYSIVMVTNADGNKNFTWGNFVGKVIPIYIRNKHRPYKIRHDIVIYLSYSPSLVKKMNEYEYSGWWSDPSLYTIDYKDISTH